MWSLHKITALAALVFSLSALSAQDQTLADAARKAQDQKAQDTGKPIKVYTNENVAPASRVTPATCGLVRVCVELA